MTLRFSKPFGKPHTLTCLRNDGSVTWSPVGSSVGAKHDLIHYVVETTLGYTEAFLGLVAQGRDLDDFGTKCGVKSAYTTEEQWAESIVGFLQWPTLTGSEFAAQLAALTPAPSVTPEQFTRICQQIADLHAWWDALPPGGTLELDFPTPRL